MKEDLRRGENNFLSLNFFEEKINSLRSEAASYLNRGAFRLALVIASDLTAGFMYADHIDLDPQKTIPDFLRYGALLIFNLGMFYGGIRDLGQFYSATSADNAITNAIALQELQKIIPD